jgi:hypothetical protein
MGRAISLTLIGILSLSAVTYLDVSAADPVRIIGHRMSLDTAGLVHISGIVENVSDVPAGFVRVTAYLFDAGGNRLPTHETYTLLRTIPSGYIAPFDIPISDKRVGSSISSYTLSLEWKRVEPKADRLEFNSINAFIWTHIDPRTMQTRNPHASEIAGDHSSHAHSEITAVVKNNGEVTKSVKVIAIWYDEKGQYYGYSMQTIARQLAPLEESRFVMMTHPTMGYYSLIAESENYVSMLVEDDRHVLRVHEANDDNQSLPGVDTMSISKIFVRDPDNRVLGRIPVKNKPVLPHFKPANSESIPIVNDGIREHQLQVRMSENELTDLVYDQETNTLRIIATSSNDLDSVHSEIIIPNSFDEFLSATSFEAELNGAVLDEQMFFVDTYSYEGKTAMHFMVSSDSLKTLAKEMKEPYSERLIFEIRSLTSKPFQVKVGEPIQIQSTVTNNISSKQKFVYVLQVRDPSDTAVMLSWIDGNIMADGSIGTALSWTPEKEGNYTMRIFLWESLDYPSVMSSNFASAKFTVS